MLRARLGELREQERVLGTRLAELQGLRTAGYVSWSPEARDLSKEEVDAARSDLHHCKSMINDVVVGLSGAEEVPEFGRRPFAQDETLRLMDVLKRPVTAEDVSTRRGGGGLDGERGQERKMGRD